jgi:hypothetical protein
MKKGVPWASPSFEAYTSWIFLLCLIIFSFSMQVIEQYEQQQGKLGDLA